MQAVRSRRRSPTGRYTLKDYGAGTFTVSITDLQESDSGIYWCGVERVGYDTFSKVSLTVSKDPRESIVTSTQPYKDIQTSTDSHTTTPTALSESAHSESPSTTAGLTSRYSSPDDITLSLSNSICEHYGIHTICYWWSAHSSDHICSWIGRCSST
ncbi:hypothetical protein QQF64_000484 [Cirrhinus molitorella]|uniref:Immunoglobulin V-set domain-containing protein n=1 Tax=Cirrhinus molitorella TaxID=172907 RepID=A0ABR3NXE5_9TELE